MWRSFTIFKDTNLRGEALWHWSQNGWQPSLPWITSSAHDQCNGNLNEDKKQTIYLEEWGKGCYSTYTPFLLHPFYWISIIHTSLYKTFLCIHPVSTNIWLCSIKVYAKLKFIYFFVNTIIYIFLWTFILHNHSFLYPNNLMHTSLYKTPLHSSCEHKYICSI